MLTRLKQPTIVGAALTVALGVFAWLVFAPPGLGGGTSYSVIRGTSMRPLLRDGDLALVRASERYEVGNVVLYRSPALGSAVLHRIEGRAHLCPEDGDDDPDGHEDREDDLHAG